MWVFPLRFASSRKPPRRLLNSEPVKNMRRTREQQILAGRAKAVLEPEFCTSTDTGRILVTVLGMVAEMEREFILERQRTGIEADKKGHLQGPQAVRASGDGAPAARRGKGPAEIATALDVSRMSVWRAAIAAISAPMRAELDRTPGRHAMGKATMRLVYLERLISVSTALCLRYRPVRSQRARLDQRHKESDGGMGCTSDHGGIFLGRGSGLHDPGPG
jgi:hypothetical protein